MNISFVNLLYIIFACILQTDVCMTKICTINIKSLCCSIIKHNSQTEFTNQSILHAVLAIGIFIYIRIYVFECCMLDLKSHSIYIYTKYKKYTIWPFYKTGIQIICTGTFFQNQKNIYKIGCKNTC